MAAKMNLATLMNYYRLFAKAKPLWDQVLVRNSSADAWDGLAVALQGLGNHQEAEKTFKKGEGSGWGKIRVCPILPSGRCRLRDGERWGR